ncbi:MAG: gephyrin-like molybdotransferase Glp [Planktomarina sp.]
MISVAAALQALLDLVSSLPAENVPLRDAAGRVLNGIVIAHRDQPPFTASAMDGYAVWANQQPETGTQWIVVGESAAGHGLNQTITSGQAARIFTGAPLPEGTNHVVIQEDIDRARNTITLKENADTQTYVRPAGADFHKDDTLNGPLLLTPARIALCAAMNAPTLSVTCKPKIAIIGTGDELCQPGEDPAADQIIASNTYGLAAMLNANGAEARILPIARDNVAALQTVLTLATDCDLIITIGGASVGDHDLVATAASDMGLNQSFYRVAMRPGKPLMAGKLGAIPMIGLPGNPVSAMVCGHVFVLPVVRKMLGLTDTPPVLTAPLAKAMPKNGPREHYMRAMIKDGVISAFGRQDSALLSVLSDANALIIRAPNADPAQIGDIVEYLPI